ncbi:tetratricopeptide repeat protein [Hazenella coriacea]|uniref:Tetratricopeptide repeat protein n=1 Tax=Hazenella coriacea TaxID=1179467 RepID=A0A4R3L971_9BACL|nr:tetratricopeptide repeat protein [Hazenella coriacea]TCS96601.1 tetratricopeptide repeat protein [Hazenella coriacea]
MSEFQRAIRCREEGRLEDAQSLLLQLIKQDPSNPQTLYQCACVHDALGLEREAIPFYEEALQLGLTSEERRGAWLGLGSTYRTLGEYLKAQETLEKGIQEFPDAHELYLFYAMVLYNLGEHQRSMEILLQKMIELTQDEGIQKYQRAILFYADQLDQVWE